MEVSALGSLGLSFVVNVFYTGVIKLRYSVDYMYDILLSMIFAFVLLIFEVVR